MFPVTDTNDNNVKTKEQFDLHSSSSQIPAQHIAVNIVDGCKKFLVPSGHDFLFELVGKHTSLSQVKSPPSTTVVLSRNTAVIS